MFSSQSQWQARFLLTPRNGLKAFRKSFCNSTFFIFLLLAQTLLKFAQVPNVQFGAHLGSVCPRSPIWLFLAVILFPHSPLDPRIQRSSFNHNRHTYSARGFFWGAGAGRKMTFCGYNHSCNYSFGFGGNSASRGLRSNFISRARTEFRSLALLFSLPNQLSGLKLTQDEEADHEIHYLIIFSHHPNELVCGDFAQNLIACLRQFM